MTEILLSKTTKFIVDNRGKTVPTVYDGIPLIATNCIDNKNLYPTYENIRYVSKEVYNSWFRSHPEPNDIILTLKGSQNGAVCLVPNPVDFVIAQDMVALRPDVNIIDPLYLFAALRLEETQQQIKNLDVSGVIPHFKKTDFDKLVLPYPERGMQKFIGEFYFSLSKKIDLLHRQNKTLEQLAETLFRQWFVEEAEEGWEEIKISDVASTNNRTVSKNFPYTEIEYLDTGSITEGKVDNFQHLQIKDAPSRAKRIVIENDIVYSLVRPIQRHYGLLHDVKPNTIVSTGFVVISCSKISPYFIYTLLTLRDTVEYLDMIAEASTSAYPSLKPSDIADFIFQMPPKDKLLTFHKMAESNWTKMKSNTQQIRTLSQLRDTLLPKLMSGEVRVNY